MNEDAAALVALVEAVYREREGAAYIAAPVDEASIHPAMFRYFGTVVHATMLARGPQASESGVVYSCSFCLKAQREVLRLIAAPGVSICDECVGICRQVLEKAAGSPTTADSESKTE